MVTEKKGTMWVKTSDKQALRHLGELLRLRMPTSVEEQFRSMK